MKTKPIYSRFKLSNLEVYFENVLQQQNSCFKNKNPAEYT